MGSYIMLYFVLEIFVVVCACFRRLHTENEDNPLSRSKREILPWGTKERPADKTCLDFCALFYDICNGGECILDSKTCQGQCICLSGFSGRWCQYETPPSASANTLPGDLQNDTDITDDRKRILLTNSNSPTSLLSKHQNARSSLTKNTMDAFHTVSGNYISPSSSTFWQSKNTAVDEIDQVTGSHITSVITTMHVSTPTTIREFISPSFVFEDDWTKPEKSSALQACNQTNVEKTVNSTDENEHRDKDGSFVSTVTNTTENKVSEIILQSSQHILSSTLTYHLSLLTISSTNPYVSEDQSIFATSTDFPGFATNGISRRQNSIMENSKSKYNNVHLTITIQPSLISHTSSEPNDQFSQENLSDSDITSISLHPGKSEIQVFSATDNDVSFTEADMSLMLNFTINGVYNNDTESLITCKNNCTGGVCLDVDDAVSCVIFTDVKNLSPKEMDSKAFCLPGFACLHGECDQDALKMGKVKCKCEPNWTGTFCHSRCDLDCGKHGYCAILETINNTVGCICTWNHTGSHCEQIKTFETDEEIQWHWHVVGACVGIFVLLLSVLVILSYWLWRCRWIFIMKIVHYFQHYEEDDGKLYDAFVSYKSSEYDENFVVHTLYPKLEQELGFKLCLHFRDFVPGDAIANNIVNAVESSRRTIMVLTPSYVESEWCRMEYQKAQHEMLKLKHKIIPIVLKDISKVTTLDKNLKSIIGAVTYLQWPGFECSKQLDRFWKQLELSLPKKKQIVSSSESVQSSHPSLSSCDTIDSVLDTNSNDSVFSVSLSDSVPAVSKTSVGQRSSNSSLKCIVRDIFCKLAQSNSKDIDRESACSSPCETLGSLSTPMILSEDILSTPLLQKRHSMPVKQCSMGDNSNQSVQQRVDGNDYIDTTLKIEANSEFKNNIHETKKVSIPITDHQYMRKSLNVYAVKTKLDVERNIFIFKSILNTSFENQTHSRTESSETQEKSHEQRADKSIIVKNNSNSITDCCSNETMLYGVDNPSFVHGDTECRKMNRTLTSQDYENKQIKPKHQKCVHFGDQIDISDDSHCKNNEDTVYIEISESF